MRSLRKLAFSATLILGLLSLSSFSDLNPNGDNPPNKPEKDASTEYCIFLGVYGEMIPVKEAVAIGNIQGASCKKIDNGQREFYSPHFDSQEDADRALYNYNDLGLTNTTILVFYQGKYYTPSEYAAL